MAVVAVATGREPVIPMDAEKSMKHIQILTQEIGSRPSGLDNEKKAADYIARYFKELSYATHLQSFPGFVQTVGKIRVQDGEKFFGKGKHGFSRWHSTVWETGAAVNGRMTEGQAVCGRIVPVDASNAVFPDALKGNIALVEKTEAPLAGLIKKAEEAGAAAVIVYNTLGKKGNLGEAFYPAVDPVDIPVLGAAKAHGLWLLEMLEQGPVTVDIETRHYPKTISNNIVAVKPAKTDNAPIIGIIGHYDSKVGAAGAWDNASGASTVMELARVLKSYDTGHVELRFIAFGSEEVGGHMGASFYVSQLSKEEIVRFSAVVCIDGVGVSHTESIHLYCRSVDGMINPIMQSALTTATRMKYPTLILAKSGFSDHREFHEVGITAVMFTSLAGEGSTGFYHTGAYSLTPYYHTIQDTIEEAISQSRLQEQITVIAQTVYDVVDKLK